MVKSFKITSNGGQTQPSFVGSIHDARDGYSSVERPDLSAPTWRLWPPQLLSCSVRLQGPVVAEIHKVL